MDEKRDGKMSGGPSRVKNSQTSSELKQTSRAGHPAK